MKTIQELIRDLQEYIADDPYRADMRCVRGGKEGTDVDEPELQRDKNGLIVLSL